MFDYQRFGNHKMTQYFQGSNGKGMDYAAKTLCCCAFVLDDLHVVVGESPPPKPRGNNSMTPDVDLKRQNAMEGQ
jgi:hypothetical protein